MNRIAVPETTFHWSRDSDPDQYRYLWDPILKMIEGEQQIVGGGAHF